MTEQEIIDKLTNHASQIASSVLSQSESGQHLEEDIRVGRLGRLEACVNLMNSYVTSIAGRWSRSSRGLCKFDELVCDQCCCHAMSNLGHRVVYISGLLALCVTKGLVGIFYVLTYFFRWYADFISDNLIVGVQLGFIMLFRVSQNIQKKTNQTPCHRGKEI